MRDGVPSALHTRQEERLLLTPRSLQERLYRRHGSDPVGVPSDREHGRARPAEPLGAARCNAIGGGGQCAWQTGDACSATGSSCCTAYDPANEAACATLSMADCEAKDECHPVLSDACGACCKGVDAASDASCGMLDYAQCVATRPCSVQTGAACEATPPASCCKGVEPRFDAMCDGLSEPECTRLDQCVVRTGAACTSGTPASCCKGVEPRFDAMCDGLSEPECTRLDQCVVRTGAACTSGTPASCCVPTPGMGGSPMYCDGVATTGGVRACEADPHCQWTGGPACRG